MPREVWLSQEITSEGTCGSFTLLSVSTFGTNRGMTALSQKVGKLPRSSRSGGWLESPVSACSSLKVAEHHRQDAGLEVGIAYSLLLDAPR